MPRVFTGSEEPRRGGSSHAPFQDLRCSAMKTRISRIRAAGVRSPHGKTHRERAGYWPILGPVAFAIQVPTVNTPVAKEGGVAAFKLQETAGKLELAPVWVSRDMFRGYPRVIANGVVYSFGSGDFTKQATPERGLNFRFVAARRGIDSRYDLRSRTGRRQGALVERRHDYVVQSLQRVVDRQREALYRKLTTGQSGRSVCRIK